MAFDWAEAVKTGQNRFAPFIYGVSSQKDLSFKDRIRFGFVERQSISAKEKSQFYQMFSVLIGSGVSSLNALQILLDKADTERFYRILLTIQYAVEQGGSLSQSFARFPDVFSQTEIGIIQSGEAVGALEGSLKRLAEQTENRHKVRQQIRSALLYPAIVGAVMVIAGIVMVTFVIPELKQLYIENGIEFTGLTKLFIGTSDFVVKYWLALLGLLGIAWVAVQIYFGSRMGRMRWHFNQLRIPYVGDIIRKYNVSMFTNSLGVLVESGVPIQQAIQLTQKAVPNELFKLKTQELIGKVQQGENISAVLATSPFLFSSNVTQILAIGEGSANLGELALGVAKQFDAEIEYKLKNLNTVIGPAVILLVAGFIVLFALAVLLPIFNLTQNVG